MLGHEPQENTATFPEGIRYVDTKVHVTDTLDIAYYIFVLAVPKDHCTEQKAVIFGLS